MSLSPSLAAYELGAAYAASTGQQPGGPTLWDQECLARALNAEPDLLEAAWNLWAWEMDSWSEVAILEARYWLDAVLIGGLPVPNKNG